MKETTLTNNAMITDPKFAHLKACTEVYNDHNYKQSLKITLDTNYHSYLCHHTFGGKCYVPATMIMELFAESALFFTSRFATKDKDNLIAGIENFNVLRAITIEYGNKIEAQINLIEISVQGSLKILSIEILSKRIAESGRVIGSRINATCEVIISPNLYTPAKFISPNHNFKQYCFPKELFYEYYFASLGKMFQTQTGNFKINLEEKMLIGTYNLEGKERNFINGQECDFILSPLGLDSCLQYTVFLSRLLALKGRLPVSCRKLQIFRNHPVNGNCNVYVQCQKIDDSIMDAFFWIFDQCDKPIVYVENVIVQYAPVNNTTEIYTNKDLFSGLLEKHCYKSPWN